MDYIDTLADNVEEVFTADNTEQPASPAENPIDQTKAFSKRLKEATEKARAEEREKIAQSYGYESWEVFNKAQTDSKLLDNGLDPETVRPVLEDLLKSDPRYLEGMRYKEEKEKLESEICANGELQRMNAKYGTRIASINDLDAETIKLWNSGLSLEKAYASQHFEELQRNIIENTKASMGSGKDHLNNTTGSNNIASVKSVSDAELRIFKRINPDMSDEEIKAYISRTR